MFHRAEGMRQIRSSKNRKGRITSPKKSANLPRSFCTVSSDSRTLCVRINYYINTIFVYHNNSYYYHHIVLYSGVDCCVVLVEPPRYDIMLWCNYSSRRNNNNLSLIVNIIVIVTILILVVWKKVGFYLIIQLLYII